MNHDDEERLLDLGGHVQALDILMRALYVRWAQDAKDDPRASALRIIEGAVGSMRANAEPDGPEERKIVDSIEEHIRTFGENVDRRLSGMGY